MNLRLSASMIKDFLSCSKKAQYRLYSPEQQEPTYQMAIGTIVHEALELHWDNFDAAMKFAEDKVRTTNLKRGSGIVFRCLLNYFENFTYLVKDTDKVEQFFRFPYNKNVTLVGKFDRITEDGIMIDWKTGYNAPTDISNDVQFMLYDYAYTKLYGEKPKHIYYVSLQGKKIIPYEENPRLVEEFFTSVLPYVIDTLSFSIKNNYYVRTGLFGYKVCDNCSFSDMCFKELGV